MTARLAICCAAAAVVCGCSGGQASQRSSTPVAPTPSPDRPTIVQLGSAGTQGGVTVAVRRMVLHTNRPPEVVIDFANQRRGARPLELLSDRVVVTQGRTRIVARDTGGGSTAAVLTGGASISGWSVMLPGFRSEQPFRLTATVTVPDDEIGTPKLKPIRFRFGFDGPVSSVGP